MNGGCEDICETDITGSVVCSCKEGRTLMDDNYRCVSTINPSSECRDDEFTCSERQCIPYDVTCDGTFHCYDTSDEDPIYCSKYSTFEC